MFYFDFAFPAGALRLPAFLLPALRVPFALAAADLVSDGLVLILPVVIVTEWEQFRALDLGRVSDLMACPVIVDLRNVYRPGDMKKHGFAYTCVGRTPTHQPVSVYISPGRGDVSTAALAGAGTAP